MNPDTELLVTDFGAWYISTIIRKQAANIQKAARISEHTVNPFLAPLSHAFFTDNNSLLNEPSQDEVESKIANGIAMAMVYQKVAGTSISTSFGTQIQRFIAEQLQKRRIGGPSMVSGMDIEFTEIASNGVRRKRYMQLKAGPQTINYDDVDTIRNHFTAARNLARMNSGDVIAEDFMVGVVYGERDELSGNYRRIETESPHRVLIGRELWHALFRDESVYDRLIAAAAKCTNENAADENLHFKAAEAVKTVSESEKVRSIARKLRPPQKN